VDIKNLSPEINKLLSDFENQNDSISHEELDLAVEILIFEIVNYIAHVLNQALAKRKYNHCHTMPLTATRIFL
jgi:hypothetical protein